MRNRNRSTICREQWNNTDNRIKLNDTPKEAFYFCLN